MNNNSTKAKTSFSMFFKLATQNILKDKITYMPFLFSSMLIVAFFYTIENIRYNVTPENFPKGSDVTIQFMIFGAYIIGFFAFIFINYTNNTLMKRRKMQLGLYSVLGMEKKHICSVVTIELNIIFAISTVVGIIIGYIFSKLMLLVLAKLVNSSTPITFSMSPTALITTLILFALIFEIICLFNVIRVARINPIDLLKDGHKGEKEPKARILLTLLGIILVGTGYYISLTIKDPISAIALFFIAVILVIIGTYLLFTTVSIFILKAMKKNRTFYYKKNNFIAVSGMLYRMKQNAVGLSNICILVCMLLITISTTMSLYCGQNDMLDNQYPYALQMNIYCPETFTDINKNVDTIIYKAKTLAEQHENVTINDYEYYESYNYTLMNDNFTLKSYDPSINLNVNGINYSDLMDIRFMNIDDYNRITQTNYTLSDNEVLLYTEKEFDTTNFKVSIDLVTKDFTIKQKVTEVGKMIKPTSYMASPMVIVVKDFDDISDIMSTNVRNMVIGFDITASDDDGVAFCNDFTTITGDYLNTENTEQYKHSWYYASRYQNKADWYALFGGFVFIGAFMCVLFTLATVMIIYYKQISEGYEDRKRFKIMEKVGMSQKEIRQNIKKQVLMVFYLPLVVAIIHTLVCMPLIIKILLAFALNNNTLFYTVTAISIAVFAIIYFVVYLLTSKFYYKIVEN